MADFLVSFGAQYPREDHPTLPGATADGLVALPDMEDLDHARRAAFAVFGAKWSNVYPIDELTAGERFEEYFPLGVVGWIDVDGTTSWEPAPPGEKTSYLVTWTIEVDAHSPHGAAVEALRIQRDSDSTATVFEVESGAESVQVVVAETF